MSREIATDLGERRSLVGRDRYITSHTVTYRYIPATDLGERRPLVGRDRYITSHTVTHRYIPATDLGERRPLVGLRRDAAPRELAEPLRRRWREGRAAVGERGGVARQARAQALVRRMRRLLPSG